MTPTASTYEKIAAAWARQRLADDFEASRDVSGVEYDAYRPRAHTEIELRRADLLSAEAERNIELLAGVPGEVGWLDRFGATDNLLLPSADGERHRNAVGHRRKTQKWLAAAHTAAGHERAGRRIAHCGRRVGVFNSGCGGAVRVAPHWCNVRGCTICQPVQVREKKKVLAEAVLSLHARHRNVAEAFAKGDDWGYVGTPPERYQPRIVTLALASGLAYHGGSYNAEAITADARLGWKAVAAWFKKVRAVGTRGHMTPHYALWKRAAACYQERHPGVKRARKRPRPMAELPLIFGKDPGPPPARKWLPKPKVNPHIGLVANLELGSRGHVHFHCIWYGPRLNEQYVRRQWEHVTTRLGRPSQQAKVQLPYFRTRQGFAAPIWDTGKVYLTPTKPGQNLAPNGTYTDANAIGMPLARALDKAITEAVKYSVKLSLGAESTYVSTPAGSESRAQGERLLRNGRRWDPQVPATISHHQPKRQWLPLALAASVALFRIDSQRTYGALRGKIRRACIALERPETAVCQHCDTNCGWVLDGWADLLEHVSSWKHSRGPPRKLNFAAEMAIANLIDQRFGLWFGHYAKQAKRRSRGAPSPQKRTKAAC